jgi:outer membrane protein insertion porin family
MLRVAAFLTLFLGLARAATAQNPAVAGACARPDSVAFRGNSRVSESALRADVGIAPGAALNYRDLQRAIKSLFATTQFEDIQVKCEVAGGRTTLAFEVRERPLLGEVVVRGTDRVSSGTVRDQVDLIVGRPVDPSLVARVVARIDSVYEAKGYYLAEVTVDSTTVSTGLMLTFRVEEGRRLAVSGIRIEGNQLLSDRAIVTEMQTRPEGFFWWKKGEFDDNKYVSDLTERIPQAYGKHGFIDAQVTRDTLVVDRERGKALVEIAVNEGPQYLVGSFEVNGSRRFADADIRRFFPFTDRGRSLRETIGSVAGFIRRRPRDPENVFDMSRWQEATQQVQELHLRAGAACHRTRVRGPGFDSHCEPALGHRGADAGNREPG